MDSVMVDSLLSEVVVSLKAIDGSIFNIWCLLGIWLLCRAVAVGIRDWKKRNEI